MELPSGIKKKREFASSQRVFGLMRITRKYDVSRVRSHIIASLFEIAWPVDFDAWHKANTEYWEPVKAVPGDLYTLDGCCE